MNGKMLSKKHFLSLEGRKIKDKSPIASFSSPGEVLLYCTRYFSKIIKMKNLSTEDAKSWIVSMCKELISVSKVEVFIKEKNKLRLLGEKDQQFIINLGSNILPSIAAISNKHQMINNSHFSSIYTSNSESVINLAKNKNILERFRNVCAVPISEGENSKVYGVIMLYDKFDYDLSSKNFTFNDVLIAQSIGLFLFELIGKSEKISDLSETISVKRSGSTLNTENFVDYSLTDRARYKKPNNRIKFTSPRILNISSNEKSSKIEELKKIMEKSENAILVYSQSLDKIIPCQKATFFLKEKNKDTLYDITNDRHLPSSGLVKVCLDSQSIINIQNKAHIHPKFDVKIDSLCLSQKIDSYLCIPILDSSKLQIGAICFVNTFSPTTTSEIALGNNLSLIPKDIPSINKSEELNENKPLTGHQKYNILLKWSIKFSSITQLAQKKIRTSTAIIQRFASENRIGHLLSLGLEMLKHLINCEDIIGIYKENHKFSKYSAKNEKNEVLDPNNVKQAYVDAIKDRRIITMKNLETKENCLIVPFVSGENAFIIEAKNKKDDCSQDFSDYTADDKGSLSEAANVMFMVLNNTDRADEVIKFKQLIQKFACLEDTYEAINSLRCASQEITNCERSIIYGREGENLIVKSHSEEFEFPWNFSIPYGKGITGTVAQQCKTAVINNIHDDLRFDAYFDNVHGYNLKNMICMPVLDSRGKAVAILEVINKKDGDLNEDDVEVLSCFAGIIGAIFKNTQQFKKSREEYFLFTNILNSIGSYTLVIEIEGKLIYSNRQVEDTLGINIEDAKNGSFEEWLQPNHLLISDINCILQNQKKRIHKPAQRIYKCSEIEKASLMFDYFLVPVIDIGTLEITGAIIILEDVTAFEELNSKLALMEQKLSSLSSAPLIVETSLQKCINKLTMISSKFEPDSDFCLIINDVIDTLKRGNLNKLKLDSRSLGPNLRSTLSEYAKFEKSPGPRIEVCEFPNNSGNFQKSDAGIEVLQNWSLNAFEVDNHFVYIKSMLKHFNLLKEFDIKTSKLNEFVISVKDHYHANPFHSFIHGFTVMHSSFWFFSNTKAVAIFKAHEILAQLIAALCHDVDHTGHTNTYEVNSSSKFAITHNDKSVLENHHASLTFHILQHESTNIFENIPPTTFRAIRKLMIKCILWTDMVKHFHMVSCMNTRFNDLNEKPIGTLGDDCEKVGALMLHLSDLGHSAKEFSLYSEWSRRVCKEFSQQYKDELENGLPTTEFMKNLDQPYQYYKGETGFLTIIAKPLWDCVNLWLGPEINICMENLNENIKRYQEKAEEASITPS
ncbi:unnamed protein product [Blepharisma stoltei]|uniref:Phosphodiesterase n=1 Tax=Blepharisma stoltei TaxID=1481888 RepID=A0AAU9JPC7_9CILI|nr:unnamed protein product [Blepharisma stoltei]